MKFRTAYPADLPALAAIERLQPRCAQWGKTGWETELTDRAACVFCAEENGRVLGFVSLRLAVDIGEILNVGVDPSVLRRGIAEQLVDLALSWAREHGGKQITLEVAATNLPAVRLYQKFGFVQVGVRKKFYANNEDALIMGRAL